MLQTLTHPGSGALAEFDLAHGFNCFRWQVPTSTGPRELLWSAPGFTAGEARPSSSGIPILFPFPGRILKGAFSFDGQNYALEQNDRHGNAIHGFVFNRPWRLLSAETPAAGDPVIAAEFHAAQDDATLLQQWPSDFRVRATYRLGATQLTLTLQIDNPGTRPLPWGCGLHPYFQLSPFGGPSVVRAAVPIGESWQLQGLVPTGVTQPTVASHPLLSQQALGESVYDDVFSIDPRQMQSDGSWVASLTGAGQQLVLKARGGFGYAVIYTPPHREAICLEPYVCVPDPWRGENRGARLLQPGEQAELAMELSWNG